MRKPSIILDTGDRQAIAGGATAGLGLMTLLALRADWLLLGGILTFRRTGGNVAAYVMGLDLLPWALVFTAMVAAGAIVSLGWACGMAPALRSEPAGPPTRSDAAPARQAPGDQPFVRCGPISVRSMGPSRSEAVRA